MNKKISIYFMAFVGSFFGGCVSKTKFNKYELKWLNVYKADDTLIFQSTKGEQDTSVILKKDIFYPPYIPFEVHDRYLPHTGEIWYKNKHMQYHPDQARMISMIKARPRKETFVNINYLYGGFIELDISTGSLEKYKKGKIYEFDCYDPRSKPSEPKMIYWHEDYGIIKYITHGGIEWNRINIADSIRINP